MRIASLGLVATLVLSAPRAADSSAAQDPHASTSHRGAAVMGFDQNTTTHHFALYTDGGTIDVSVKEAINERDLRAIRSHLPHISEMFGRGNFEAPMLVHDSTDVPGTAEMTRLRHAIAYTYVETPSGGRVEIVSSDPSALAAIHSFLRFQIEDHKTGDSLEVRKRSR